MSNTSSSLFVDHPKSFLDEEGESTLRQAVSSLRFQLSSLKTEKKLLEEDQERIRNKYEGAIISKSEDLSNLQKDFDYLYKDRENVKTKLDNVVTIERKERKALESQLEQANAENNKLRKSNETWEMKYAKVLRDYERRQTDSRGASIDRENVDSRIANLEARNKSLIGEKEDLLGKLKEIAEQLVSNSTEKYSKNLQNRNLSLQQANNQLQSRIDQLLQHKTSVELLKQKNIALKQRLDQLQEIEEKYCKLEIENIQLSNRFNTYFGVLEDDVKDSTSNETSVLQFVQRFKELQNANLVLNDKYNQTNVENSNYQNELLAMQSEHNELKHEVDYLKKTIISKEEMISEYERQKFLNSKEIEFLRNLLREKDALTEKQSKVAVNEKVSEQYLCNLEKSVDEYRNEVNKLQKELLLSKASTRESEHSIKRQKVSDDDLTSTIKLNMNNLETDNMRLRTKLKNLEDEKERLMFKTANLEEALQKKKELQVLQLKANPVTKDQIVKQQALDLLRRENYDLLEKILKQEMGDTIPKSVFERQENEMYISQTKIDQLEKRILRLREVYSSKSKDILLVISKFFGYSIEFIPSAVNPNDMSSRIKLVSKYDKNENGKSHLILDVTSKSLKANGNPEFRALCEDLTINWVNNRDQIPCFLSALTLCMYERNANN